MYVHIFGRRVRDQRYVHSRAVGRSENPGRGSINVVGINNSPPPSPDCNGVNFYAKIGGGGDNSPPAPPPPHTLHCVLKWGFMRTSPGNQDVTLK